MLLPLIPKRQRNKLFFDFFRYLSTVLRIYFSPLYVMRNLLFVVPSLKIRLRSCYFGYFLSPLSYVSPLFTFITFIISHTAHPYDLDFSFSHFFVSTLFATSTLLLPRSVISAFAFLL